MLGHPVEVENVENQIKCNDKMFFMGCIKLLMHANFLVAKSLGNWGWYFLFPWIVWGGRPTPGNRQLCGRQKKHYTLSPKKHKVPIFTLSYSRRSIKWRSNCGNCLLNA